MTSPADGTAAALFIGGLASMAVGAVVEHRRRRTHPRSGSEPGTDADADAVEVDVVDVRPADQEPADG